MDRLLLSLCMPTDGVAEWVFPVLDSIFSQKVDTSLYEVVITDNGDNAEFKEKMKVYLVEKDNLKYYETNAGIFLNEIESYKRASGEFIKFVNHRSILQEGALQYLVDFVKNNMEERPIVYFMTGALKMPQTVNEYDSFDGFVRGLSYYSSWSSGMAIWRENLEFLPEKVEDFNELFPHTTVLFNVRDSKKYIIDNTVLFNDIPVTHKKKGKYDLYFAFGVDYLGIICDLYRDGDISLDTYKFVAKENLNFIAGLYLSFNVLKQEHSYDVSNLKGMFGVFYSRSEFVWAFMKKILKTGINRK